MEWWHAPHSSDGVAVPFGKSLDGVMAWGAGAAVAAEGAATAGPLGAGACALAAEPASASVERKTAARFFTVELLSFGLRMKSQRPAMRTVRYGSPVTESASKDVTESAFVHT